MKDWMIGALAEGAGRAMASLLLLPVTYGMLQMFLWLTSEWAALPEITNRQVVLLAVAIAIFGR